MRLKRKKSEGNPAHIGIVCRLVKASSSVAAQASHEARFSIALSTTCMRLASDAAQVSAAYADSVHAMPPSNMLARFAKIWR